MDEADGRLVVSGKEGITHADEYVTVSCIRPINRRSCSQQGG